MWKNVSRLVSTNVSETRIKTFNEIPGPKGFLNMGTIFFNYLPVIGEYNWNELHLNGLKKMQGYGKIVREKMLPGVYVLWLFDPKDIATVVNEPTTSGNYPQRRSHLATLKYRKDRPEMYRFAGLIPTNGAEWWRMRSELQKCMSSPSHVRVFLPDADQITREFVDQLDFEYDDFLPEIERLNLELVCHLAFDIRLNSFTDKERKTTSLSSKLISASYTINSLTLSTDQGLQLWRLFETRDYKRLKENFKYLEDVAGEIVEEKYSELENKTRGRKSFFNFYLENPNLEKRDVLTMAIEFLIAGIDTTSYSTAFLLYHLAKSPRVQDKLYEEAKKILDGGQGISASMLNSEIPYARAVLKESMRLSPVSVGVGRVTNSDMILSGYHIPKGTTVVTQGQVISRLTEHFKSPNDFIPERWIKTETQYDPEINKFVSLPFGHGPRSCIARRLAEQDILLLVIRLMRNFKLEWTGADPIEFETKIINQPKSKVGLKFSKRIN